VTARSVMESARYGTVDGAIVHAVNAAHRSAADDPTHNYTRARVVGTYMALGYADHGGPEVVGAFLMAYMSTLAAIDLEVDDMRKVFSDVADEWWKAHPRGANYGAPWSSQLVEVAA